MTTEKFLRTAGVDMTQVMETLCVAFDRDPVTEWTFPRSMDNRDKLVEGFFRVITEMVLDHGGQIGATPDYAAVSVWSPPGEPTLTATEEADLVENLLAACGEGGERAVAVMRALDAGHPAGLPPHFHVTFAAVRPETQTRGSASMASQALARAALTAGAGLYAEASNQRSLALWERLGLRRIGDEITLPGGPSLYPIWGPPGGWHTKL
jgi:ribosomal protein S18 acetylase RimI-like enzyme